MECGSWFNSCKVFKWELPEGEENEQNTCFCTALKMLKFYHLCSQIFYRFATKKITSLLQTLQFCYNFFGFWVLVCFPNPPEFPTHDKPNSILQSTWTLNASGVLKMKITSWDLSLMRYKLERHASRQVRSVWKSLGRISFRSRDYVLGMCALLYTRWGTGSSADNSLHCSDCQQPELPSLKAGRNKDKADCDC